MREILYGLKLSFSYFSILPVKFKDIIQTKKSDKAFLFFIPFVGGVLSLLAIMLFTLLSCFFPPFYAAVFSGVFYMTLYGFLHLEAVIDTVDALFASHSGKDVYKIMKEPTVGAVGVVFVVLFLILKMTAVSYLLTKDIFYGFLTAAVFARLSIIFTLKYFDIHPKSALANTLKNSLSKKIFFFMILFYLLFAFILTGIKALFVIALSFLLTIVLSSCLKKKTGFINGDILGFIIEMNEFLVLNLFLAV